MAIEEKDHRVNSVSISHLAAGLRRRKHKSALVRLIVTLFSAQIVLDRWKSRLAYGKSWPDFQRTNHTLVARENYRRSVVACNDDFLQLHEAIAQAVKIASAAGLRCGHCTAGEQFLIYIDLQAYGWVELPAYSHFGTPMILWDEHKREQSSREVLEQAIVELSKERTRRGNSPFGGQPCYFPVTTPNGVPFRRQVIC